MLLGLGYFLGMLMIAALIGGGVWLLIRGFWLVTGKDPYVDARRDKRAL